MQMSRILLTYAVSVPVFFIVDMIWLGIIAKGFYRKALEPLLTPNINWAAAIIFYLLFLVGILVFALLPGMEKRSLGYTVVMAALFGFIAYATYDLTNLATLRDWPLMLSIVDMLWGAFLSTSTATMTYLIMSRI
ncbi:MAG: DUF2177 family protein [Phycisphaerae bacterium]|nr:DUF2177 family protein [Fodinibius sp.]NIU58775.1 DUF2177 family protein [Phycisphaerae bacterium]NIV16219.1 DUF2177 family protein [Fodinibius sp.]NIW95048.1 DUF2177 family protein [Phycisphaerae bacterium]NIY30191.1 DUF2177 family protein [Fodinibius sp.]